VNYGAVSEEIGHKDRMDGNGGFRKFLDGKQGGAVIQNALLYWEGGSGLIEETERVQ